MKTQLVPLIGDPVQNLYQLGLRERQAFLKIENRVTKLLSTSLVLRFGQDILSRARTLLKKRKHEETFFDQCVKAYSEGLGIDSTRYFSFLSLLEVAAHYGQVYPELKSILPGCTSVIAKNGTDFTHTRLLDFPLIGLFDEAPRIYYWQQEGKVPLLSYSCEGLAPLFFQGIHGSGMSFALHHKPGKTYHHDGQSIFQITFESLFEAQNQADLKKEIKKRSSITKWSLILLENTGIVQVIDVDGPAQNAETYNLNETSPLVFTNIPLSGDANGFESFINFCELRQSWIKEKLKKESSVHILHQLTDVEDQKNKQWTHPAATLSTIGAYHVNLTQGYVDVKDGDAALVASDGIMRIPLSAEGEPNILEAPKNPTPFEASWKRASKAQSAFDQGEYDVAYHELQMALAQMPHATWKEIFKFYLLVWDFKFISNEKELALIYKKLKMTHVPLHLHDQWLLLIMRLEKQLNLVPTVEVEAVSEYYREMFRQEKLASRPLFATWMKLLYPRMEILDIFSPHRK